MFDNLRIVTMQMKNDHDLSHGQYFDYFEKYDKNRQISYK